MYAYKHAFVGVYNMFCVHVSFLKDAFRFYLCYTDVKKKEVHNSMPGLLKYIDI